MAEMILTKTISERGKIGGDGTVLGKVRVGGFPTGWKTSGLAVRRSGDRLRRDAIATLREAASPEP